MSEKLTLEFLGQLKHLSPEEAEESLNRLVKAAYARGLHDGFAKSEMAATAFGMEWCSSGECTRHKVEDEGLVCHSPYCASAWCIVDRIRDEAENDDESAA